MSVIRRGSFAGIALLIAALTLFSVSSIRPADVSAQIACSVDFSLPGGSSVALYPGESYSFSYSALVSASGISAITVDISTQSISNLIVAIQPSTTSVDGLQQDIPQAVPVFGRIVVSVPESASPGVYQIAGIGATATCSASSQGVEYETTARSNQVRITVDVLEPEPTPTPEPTPIPIPPVCEPGLSIVGENTVNAFPGDQIIVPYEASIVVRRIFDASIQLEARDQGSISVRFEPDNGHFTFDPLPSGTTLRTFTGNVILDIPAAQPPGTYGINGLVALATCQGVDIADDVTTISGTSSNASLSIRLTVPPTATPEPTDTPTPEPTSTATTEPAIDPTSTATATAPPAPSTATSVPDASPTPLATSTSTSTATAEPSATASPTSTPRSIVRPPVGTIAIGGEVTPTPTERGDEPTSTPDLQGVGLLWDENRETIEVEPTEESNWARPLAGSVAFLMIAAGSAGLWYTRLRG